MGKTRRPRVTTPTRIFVFCDGTGQNATQNTEPTQDTNVQRFKTCVPESRFVKHVGVAGVGTHAPENAGRISVPKIVDKGYQATGGDIHSIIHDLYFDLCAKYENNAGAEIHLIGFSRGAFAVRSLACLIDKMGLLKEKYVTRHYKEVYEIWSSQNKTSLTSWAEGKRGSLAVHPVSITSCGVWDTVSAIMASPTLSFVKTSPTLSFVKNTVPTNLKFAFQALALHESRHFYKPILWKHDPSSKTHIRQCWFAGDHSDIGGGWPDCGLANLTLVWMLAQYATHFTNGFIRTETLYTRLCPAGEGKRYLSHTLSGGNVHHCSFPPALMDGVQVRKSFLGKDAGEYGNASFEDCHRQTIHFTVRLFLAKNRPEVTQFPCILTTGSTRLMSRNDAEQRSVAWVLDIMKKNEIEKEKNDEDNTKHDGKKTRGEKKKNRPDTLGILEDETTEWENTIINTWTMKAQKLVDKEVGNIFEKGIKDYNMTIAQIVRGYKDTRKARSLNPGQIWDACKHRFMIQEAWRCSLEWFLRENRKQGTCEAAYKVLYRPPVEGTTTKETLDDPHNTPDPRDGNLSDGPALSTRVKSFEKGKKQQKRSRTLSEDVTSYDSQRVNS